MDILYFAGFTCYFNKNITLIIIIDKIIIKIEVMVSRVIIIVAVILIF